MRIKTAAYVAYWCVMIYAGFSFLPIESAGAVSAVPVYQLATPKIDLSPDSNPQLSCTGSGELTGNHPGWSSAAAIKLTLVDIGNSNFGVYWCAAGAPKGKGIISYTVTSSLDGISCETIETNCGMAGVSAQATFSILATDQTGSYPIKGRAYQNSGNIINCVQGEFNCVLGPINSTFSSFGNDASTGLKNCTFAAVGNWESAALGIHPDPQIMNADFIKSGGATKGLSNDQVFAYWSKFGIGGTLLKTATPLFTDPESLKASVSDPKIQAVIAQLYFGKGQNFAGVTMDLPTYHWVVIDGFTPAGPLAISWGKTLQMTWQQWNVEVVSAWKIAVQNM